MSSQKTVLLLNGPNLNLLGTREPHIYGSTTLADVEQQVMADLQAKGVSCECFQSNSEGALIDWLHAHRGAHFLILNPGGYTHTSVALRDAIGGIAVPFLEVHVSNIHKREPFRHHSYFSDAAVGCLIGLGVQGYRLAAQFAADWLERQEG
ncbi:MAG: type II 3-dehydroquinate dehydratase [bacterium]|jgi:3-dehydroquinate dehydratase-2